MKQISSTVFAGAFFLLTGIRFLVATEYQPESAILIAFSLILIVNGRAIEKGYRHLSMLLRGMILGGLVLLVISLAAASLHLAASTQVIAEARDLTSVPH